MKKLESDKIYERQQCQKRTKNCIRNSSNKYTQMATKHAQHTKIMALRENR